MKNILTMVMIMLCITTTTVVAQSKGDKMTTRGTEFILNSVNQDIEIKPGITAGMWANVIRTYAGKKFPSVSFETVWANSVKKTGTLTVFNTYWKNGRAQVTMLDTIYTTYYEYNGEVWLVEECGQPIGSDPGMITNSIKEGLAAGQVGNNNFKKDNNKKIMENTTVVFASGASEYGPWWMWFIGAALILGLVALLRPGARQRFISGLRDGWAVEDEVLNQNERRIRRADDWQADRNDWLHRESERQRRRYQGDRPQ